jgi:hypothetical protein
MPIDPITALGVASSAVSSMRNLINAGRDTSSAISKYARARNPKWFEHFSGSLEERAATAFACKKKAEALNKQLCDMIQFVHGPSGLKEYKTILREMREQKKKNEFRKQEIKDAVISWTLGSILAIAGSSLMGVIFYFIGKSQGRW